MFPAIRASLRPDDSAVEGPATWRSWCIGLGPSGQPGEAVRCPLCPRRACHLGKRTGFLRLGSQRLRSLSMGGSGTGFGSQTRGRKARLGRPPDCSTRQTEKSRTQAKGPSDATLTPHHGARAPDPSSTLPRPSRVSRWTPSNHTRTCNKWRPGFREAPRQTGNRPPVCVRTRRRLKPSVRRIVHS